MFESTFKTKNDCFAYSKERRRCEALTYTYCTFEDTCAFYKTKEQVEKEEKERKRNHE